MMILIWNEDHSKVTQTFEITLYKEKNNLFFSLLPLLELAFAAADPLQKIGKHMRSKPSYLSESDGFISGAYLVSTSELSYL